ncbi:MAG TPA: DedA family protein [Gammaproteobacteria bacterium]|nr:DedA family protein [Gammaproteobacteria bacterium]
MVEGFGILAPGQTLMVASAVLAAQGQMNIVLVAGLSFAAAVLGDNIGYAIGRFGGRKLLLRHGRYIGLRTRHLDKVEDFVHRYGSNILLFARFIDLLRQTAGIGSGIGEMRWWRFALFDAIGCALWVGAWTSVAYLFGEHLDAIVGAASAHPVWLIGGGVLIVVLIGGVIVYKWRHRIFGRTSNDD